MGVKRDCFCYNPLKRDCDALNELFCAKEEKCKFYKLREQAYRDFDEAHERYVNRLK